MIIARNFEINSTRLVEFIVVRRSTQDADCGFE